MERIFSKFHEIYGLSEGGSCRKGDVEGGPLTEL